MMECTLTIVLLVMNQRPYLDINSDGVHSNYCLACNESEAILGYK